MLVEDILFAAILLGFVLGVFAVVAEFLSWRSHQVATLQATVGLRALYQRSVKRTKGLATRSLRTFIP
jgi:hypothetical protein